MPIFTGIDKNHKVLQTYIASDNTYEGGEIAVRAVRHDSDIIRQRIATNNLPVAVYDSDIYTVPAGYIFELNRLVALWSGTGTITVISLYAVVGGVGYVLDRQPAGVINQPLIFDGRVHLVAGDIVRASYTVTVINANVVTSCFGLLHPNP